MPAQRTSSQLARAALLAWAIAVVVYIAAIFHRTSLGVASLQAAERFHLGPAALGMFTVLQVGVYTLLQIPTGLLVDHFGPRRVLAAAAGLMGLGQLLFAFVESYPLGLLARAVVGVGDAMSFVSVLRLVAAHFPARRYGQLVTLTGALGALGSLLATLPLTLLLDGAGWTTTFLTVGAATAGYGIVVASRLRDVPPGESVPVASTRSIREVLAEVSRCWRVAGNRLCFWVHFSTMSVPTMLALLWGFPYLVRAQGLSAGAAGSVLGVLVIGGLAGAPAVAAVISRRPHRRLALVVGYLAGALAAWAVLLGMGRVPVGVLVLVFGWISLGSPVSSVAFALARDYNPVSRVGTATGVVNVGGYFAITLSTLGVGVLLDLTGSYRTALLIVPGLLVLGGWRTLVWLRSDRAHV